MKDNNIIPALLQPPLTASTHAACQVPAVGLCPGFWGHEDELKLRLGDHRGFLKKAVFALLFGD